MTNLTPIINALIALCAAAITAFIIPWMKQKISADGLSKMCAWVEIAVEAAEQLYESTQGEQKKEYVLSYLQSKGYKVDSKDIDNAIEAAVLNLHHELYGGNTQ